MVVLLWWFVIKHEDCECKGCFCFLNWHVLRYTDIFWLVCLYIGTNAPLATNNLRERIILLSIWRCHTTQFISQSALFVKSTANLLSLCENILLVKYLYLYSDWSINELLIFICFSFGIGPLAKENCAMVFSDQGCNLCMQIFDDPDSLSKHKEACSLSAPVPLVSYFLNFF